MTATAISRAAGGHVRFSHAARMEWIKLRSLRSTWWAFGVTVAGAVGIAVAVGSNTKDASADLTNNALAGVSLGLLLSGVLGVLVMTAEYSSGMIRATLTAFPNRPLLLAAKAAVLGAATLVVGEATAFVAFFAGSAALPGAVPAPALGHPGVLRAVVLGGAGFCLIGLIGLGIGAIIRHTPSSIAILVGGVYVLAQIVGLFARPAMSPPYGPGPTSPSWRRPPRQSCAGRGLPSFAGRVTSGSPRRPQTGPGRGRDRPTAAGNRSMATGPRAALTWRSLHARVEWRPNCLTRARPRSYSTAG